MRSEGGGAEQAPAPHVARLRYVLPLPGSPVELTYPMPCVLTVLPAAVAFALLEYNLDNWFHTLWHGRPVSFQNPRDSPRHPKNPTTLGEEV